MNMKKVFFFIVWMCQFGGNILGQNWAGPDTTSCGELGVVIGSNDPCPGCCYFWSPTIGLSDHKIKNPTAKPKTETIYSVTVTDSNLRLKGTDQVTVGLSFGEMRFNPDFLVQGSDESEVHATLLKLGDVDQPSEIVWDIFGPTLNCEYTPQGLGAIYTPGNLYGEILVEARKVSVPGCFVQETLAVNNGVKDVWAIDPDHMTRIAKTGETLVLINHEEVIIHAIPNPGGFEDGIPDWKPDSYGSTTPADGDDYFLISQDLDFSDVTSDYIAGDEPDFQPKVSVIRKPPQTTLTTNLVAPGFAALATSIKNLIQFKKVTHVNPACGDLSPFSVTITTPTLKFNKTLVEIHADPGLSYKREVTGEVAFSVAGRMYHPVLTKNIQSKYFNFSVCSKLFAEFSGGLSSNIKVIKDPSLPDSTWRPEAASNELMALTIAVGGGLELGIAPMGYLFTAKGKISTSFKSILYFEELHLKCKGILYPATVKVEAKIQKLTDPGKYEDLALGLGNLSAEFQIFDPIVSPVWDIMDLNPYDE
jgi:hypothetical protein